MAILGVQACKRVTRVSVPFTDGHYCGKGERPNTELAQLFTWFTVLSESWPLVVKQVPTHLMRYKTSGVRIGRCDGLRNLTLS